MADKELTVFVVDVGPYMHKDSYEYLFETTATKLLKGLKTDYVSVVAFHSHETNHQLELTGKFRGINVLVDFEAPSFSQLKKLREVLVPQDSIENEASDSFQSLVFSISLFQETKKKAFKRNIVVITSSESLMPSYTQEKIDALPNLLSDLGINLIVIGTDFKPSNPKKVEQNWLEIGKKFGQYYLLGKKEAYDVLRYSPPVKKTRPMPLYKGELRLGADFAQMMAEKHYDPSEDDTCLVWQVEVYPAAKSETNTQNLHEYLVDGDKAVRIERNTKKFIWEKNFQAKTDELIAEEDADDKQFDKVYLDHETTVPGFKFSNFDLIALDSDLQEAAKLKLTSEFDIFSFLKVSSLPYSYFTDETSFIVPEKSSSFKNTLIHFAFCQTLYEKGIAPVARFVRKQAKEVEVGALVPVKVKYGATFSYCYIFVRLPFKEDEKIGNFAKLLQRQKEDHDKTNDDASKKDSLMDDFINMRTYVGDDDLDETKDFKSTIDNFKVTMKTSESSKLSLPMTFKSSDPFLCNSPATNKFSFYLRKALLRSLEIEDWVTYCQDERFVEKVLRENQHSTNLFNLENALLTNSTAPLKWLKEKADTSHTTSKRLVEAFDIKYVRKIDVKKSKGNKNDVIFQQKGNYGADEGDYDAVPDFDF